MGKVFLETLEDLGEVHGGRAILVAVVLEDGRYEAIYWVHPALAPVLQAGPGIYGREEELLPEFLRCYDARAILNTPTPA